MIVHCQWIQEIILRNNDRASIAKAITLVESSNPKDKEESKQLISSLINHPGHSIRVGFSGPPGVGKSTFIESFGTYLVNKNYKLAILAIDPSSNLTGGSILGDKTRIYKIVQSGYLLYLNLSQLLRFVQYRQSLFFDRTLELFDSTWFF